MVSGARRVAEIAVDLAAVRRSLRARSLFVKRTVTDPLGDRLMVGLQTLTLPV